MRRQRPDGTYQDLGPGHGICRGEQIAGPSHLMSETPQPGYKNVDVVTMSVPSGRKRGALPTGEEAS